MASFLTFYEATVYGSDKDSLRREALSEAATYFKLGNDDHHKLNIVHARIQRDPDTNSWYRAVFTFGYEEEY